LALAVPLSRFTPRVGGGSAFYVRPLTRMTQNRNIPTPLSVVSYLFLIMGFMAAIEILAGLTRGAFHFNLAILGFWIFFGLRRYSPGWRTCALVFVWIGMIIPCLMFVLVLFLGRPGNIKIFGQRYDGGSSAWMLIPVAFFALEFWMYRVLTRPDIRSMFYDESQRPVA